jgi:phosphomannomutase
MSLMVSISGIRGVIGETLTPDVVVRYAAAFGQYCRQKHPGKNSIVVGRDGRISGSTVQHIVVATLRSQGFDVRVIGICPTPTVQLAVEQTGAAGGIAITASHNPMQWNGLKFMASTGMFLDAAENREFWALADAPAGYVPWDKLGKRIPDDHWLTRHVDQVLALPLMYADAIRARKFRVVLDCINAAGGMIVPPMLDKLGCTIIPINCDVSGVFSHTPEPIPENLVSLAEKVKAEKADIGIAVDPDVDRLVLITEKGEPYSEEYTIASCVQFVLSRLERDGRAKGSRVVVNLSTTRAVDDIAASFGATVTRTAVGEINVARKMKEIGSVIGGEGSGGVILPDVHLGRDAIVGIGLILQLLAESGTTLSGLKARLPQYSIAKGKVELKGLSPEQALERIREKHGERGKVNTDDGLKIDFADSWVHLRKSNTEPIVRIIAEAPTMEQASDTVKSFTAELA